MKKTTSFVVDLQDIDQTVFSLVGGKGANLGELSGIDGIKVPGGFCITTDAFKRAIEAAPQMSGLLDQLALLKVENRYELRQLSAILRQAIEAIVIPQDIAEEVLSHLYRLGEENAYAVRSSATAEDLPTASFAGQQDSYLNIIGKEAILQHISKCWASLFTERAVIYRLQHGFDHRKVQLAVVVQQMIFPEVAGILFTADPVTGNRKVSSIDASFGLGEALVSGLVNADHYKVCNDIVTDKKISPKKQAVYAVKGGGTVKQVIEDHLQDRQALTDEQIVRLARTGRTIEAHFGYPQDIEWCLADDVFYVVQSRPVTTLFPIPEADDQENHVYISTGHQQMMTDAMKPLGLSFFLLMTPALMRTAGGRLFVDVAPMLASPSGRNTIINVLGKFDPLMKDALTTIVSRGDFIKTIPDDQEADTGKSAKAAPRANYEAQIDYDPAIVPGLIARSEASLASLKQNIQTKSGTELFDFILEDIPELRKFTADPQSFAVIMTAMNTPAQLNEKMMEWLGEGNVADTLSQSVSNNVTSEMGLALLDVADVIRPFPEVIAYLQQAKDDTFLAELPRFNGGAAARDAINTFLDQYGMRCAGEIDITRNRWREKPSMLLPAILGNIKNFAPGAGARKFEEGLREALRMEQELTDRLRKLPDGEAKVEEAKRMIAMIRNYSGYREYPKYAIVSRYFVYKQALLKEAAQLVQAGVIKEKEDIYYLTFEELREVVRTHRLEDRLIPRRKDEFKIYEKLSPPRLITSDGEIINGAYKREDLPPGAIAGLAVSSGIIEGRARVILNMEDAELEEGDILVTSFTDPSWTPLFVSIKGLVTEVGGLMTHGAVIAREYGLPAVVGVENATKLIKDGDRIRVHGTEGYIVLL